MCSRVGLTPTIPTITFRNRCKLVEVGGFERLSDLTKLCIIRHQNIGETRVLSITVGTEVYDEKTNRFSLIDTTTIEFEHSLLSISKWEAEFEKPFLGTKEKTAEELLKYICYMIVNDVSFSVVNRLSTEQIKLIFEYIQAKRTATFHGELPSKPGRTEPITAELIYFWMFSFRIPIECEQWHLNQLFALIRIFNNKNAPKNKQTIPKHELAARNRAENERRKAQLNSTG